VRRIESSHHGHGDARRSVHDQGHTTTTVRRSVHDNAHNVGHHVTQVASPSHHHHNVNSNTRRITDPEEIKRLAAKHSQKGEEVVAETEVQQE